MTCCQHIAPLVEAIAALLAYTDKQYLSPELREATIKALVAKANAEARTCTVCKEAR